MKPQCCIWIQFVNLKESCNTMHCNTMQCNTMHMYNAHCSNGSYRTFYAGKFSIYEISIYSIHETLRDCLRYTWVKALHSNFFPSVQQELSPKPVAPRQWNNLYPPQFYQTNILTRFDGRGGTGLETAGLWSCTFCTFKAPKVTHWRYIRRQRICEVKSCLYV